MLIIEVMICSLTFLCGWLSYKFDCMICVYHKYIVLISVRVAEIDNR